MNNKDLLPSGSQKKLDGIWEITVGEWSNFYGKCIAGNDATTGSMTCLDKQNPDWIIGTNNESFKHENYFILRTSFIGALYNYMSFPRVHEPNLSETAVYIHLKRGSEIISKAAHFDRNRSSVQGFDPEYPYLFTEDDVGKTYRMYIGPLDTPPPLAITKIFGNSLVYKELPNA